MTNNQLTYLGLQETKRNNLAVAAETNRSNLARETETHRANLKSEAFTRKQVKETNRHNLATEKLTRYQTDTSAATSRYVADTNYSASKYNADTKAASEAANRVAQQQIAAKANQTQVKVSEINAEVLKSNKMVDFLMNQKNISSKEKQTLQQIKKDMAITQKNIKQQKVKMVNDDILTLIKESNANLRAMIQSVGGTAAKAFLMGL